jgi:hypothetical protein
MGAPLRHNPLGCNCDGPEKKEFRAKLKAAKERQGDIMGFRVLPVVVMKNPDTGHELKVNARDQMLFRGRGYEVIREENLGAPDASPGTVPRAAPAKRQRHVISEPDPQPPKGE